METAKVFETGRSQAVRIPKRFRRRQGTPIGAMDTLIAAHARAEDMTLVTNNVREFARVPNLRLENRVV